MSPNALPAWHTTEDDQPVRVKIVSEVPHPLPQNARPRHSEPLPLQPRSSLGVSALLGIGAVLVLLVWYFGLGSNLLGDIGQEENVLTITAEGVFDPTEMTLHPGGTLTIRNEHADPQVLKSVSGRELFPVQVVFEEPVTITIPSDALGPYSYFSETLPEGTVTFVIAEAMEQSAASEDARENELLGDDPIPIPFGSDEIPTSAPSATPVTPPETEAIISTHAAGPATISLGGSASRASSEGRKISSVNIPTNPYTVGATGADQYLAGAVQEFDEDTLHSGAPLAQYTEYRPPVATATGPEHTAVLVLFLAGIAFAFVAQRMLRA